MEDFELLSNGMRILQTDALFRLGTDSILLADFARPARGSRIADLGCGCGALGVLLCAADPDCRVTGVELQERACEIAERNSAVNRLSGRFSVICGDLRQISTLLPAGQFDCVVSNPPYFPVGSGEISKNEALAISRTELCCTPDNLCAAARWLLRYGGSFFLVHRAERLVDLICALRAARLEPKRLRFVRHRPDVPASVVLLECRLGGNVGLNIENDLILHGPDGEPTAEYRRIYHIP